MDDLRVFVPITKVDRRRQEVVGVLAEERKDRTGEIFDYASSKPYLEKWISLISDISGGRSKGNLREMHDRHSAAGKALDWHFDDEAKQVTVRAKVVDPVAFEKCLEGVYNGFSLGGRYLRRWRDAADPTAHRYTALPTEFSLADNPCMYGASFAQVLKNGSTLNKTFEANETPCPDMPLAGLDADATLVVSRVADLQKLVAEVADAAAATPGDGAAAQAALAVARFELGKAMVALVSQRTDGTGQPEDDAARRAGAGEVMTQDELNKAVTDAVAAAMASDAVIGPLAERVRAQLEGEGGAINKVLGDLRTHTASLEKVAGVGDTLTKVAEAQQAQSTQVTHLEKSLGEIQAAVTEYDARLKKIEAMPAGTPPARLTVHGLPSDNASGLPDAATLEKMTETERALAYARHAQSQPFTIDMPRTPTA